MPPDPPRWSWNHGRAQSWFGKVREFHIVWKVANLALANMTEIQNLPAVIEIAQNRDQTL